MPPPSSSRRTLKLKPLKESVTSIIEDKEDREATKLEELET